MWSRSQELLLKKGPSRQHSNILCSSLRSRYSTHRKLAELRYLKHNTDTPELETCHFIRPRSPPSSANNHGQVRPACQPFYTIAGPSDRSVEDKIVRVYGRDENAGSVFVHKELICGLGDYFSGEVFQAEEEDEDLITFHTDAGYRACMLFARFLYGNPM